MVDVESPEQVTSEPTDDSLELAVAQERTRGLEARNVELNKHIERLTLALPAPKPRPWWRFWK